MGIHKLQRVYYKRTEVETPWTQPVLSANGTIGGDSFACDQKSYYSSGGTPYYAYRAFDNNISTDWENDSMTVAGLTPPTWISWYNPNPLKISKITIISGGAGGYHNPKDFKIQVSDDNINWSDIYTGTNSLTGSKITWSIDINSPSFFKYWRFYILTTNENNNPNGYVMPVICEIYLTATTLEETIVPGTADDYDFYEDKMLKIGEFYEGSTKIGSLYKGSILVFGKTQTIFEQETPGIYTITIPYEADFKITAVGAGGRANYRCAYDDRGYIGCGGSGGAFIGKIHLTPGRYDVQIGSCAAGSSRTTFINEVLTVGGGGDGATNPIGGAAGAAPIFDIQPVSQDLNTAGNAGGAYSSGNGGGGRTWNYTGAASVYGGYGRGGGGKVCEYASTSSANEASGEPYNPTNGYLKIEL